MHSLGTTTNVIWSDTRRVSQPVFSLMWHDSKLTQPHGDWRTLRACPLWLHFWSVQLNFLTGWISALQITGFFYFLPHFVWEESLGYQENKSPQNTERQWEFLNQGPWRLTIEPLCLPFSSFYFSPLFILYLSIYPSVCVYLSIDRSIVCVCWGPCVKIMRITCGNEFSPSLGGFQD